MAQVTSKQHYVPKFYLKNFSDGQGQLNVLHKQENRMGKKKQYTSVCYQEFFYGLNTGVQDELSQAIEDFFQSLETKISADLPLIIKKIGNPNEQLTFLDRNVLSWLMSMLYLRGLYMREQIKQMQQDVYKQILQLTLSNEDTGNTTMDKIEKDMGIVITAEQRRKLVEAIEDKEFDQKYKLETNNAIHVSMLKNISGFRNLFFNGKKWKIFISKSNRKFITSDNPLVEIIPKRTTFYGIPFTLRDHYLSLTPEILIEMKYPQGSNKINRKILDPHQILKYNFVLGNGATDYIYSKSKLELEELILDRNQSIIFKTI